MMVKLIQYWDILLDEQESFDEFFNTRYLPQINQSEEMKIVGSWILAAGGGQRFIVESVSETLKALKSMLCSDEYQDLKHQLWYTVHNYHSKLLLPNDVVNPALKDVEDGYKLTQHFNINAGDTYGFDNFLRTELMPVFSTHQIDLVGCWKAAVGATPYVIIESRVKKLEQIGEMMVSLPYQELISSLLTIVSNYGCKILTPSGHLKARA